jgi:hypothetical protein
MPRINEKLPFSLATIIAEANAAYERSDFAADFAIGSQPWIAATSDRFEFSRVTTAYQKERVDQESSAGENSLSNWWLRSATSWNRGEGDVFYDANESDLYKFADSWNVDVWTEGQATLLPATEKVFNGEVSSLSNCPNGIWFISGGTVRHWDGTTFHTYSSVATHGTAQQLATDGCSAYVGTTKGLYRILASDGSITKLYHATANSSSVWDVEALGIVKERLVIGVEHDSIHYVFELATNPASPPESITVGDAIYTSSSPNIQFVSVTETGASILVAYNVGNVGRVIAFTIDQTAVNSFQLPALSAAITVAKFPTGETINVIREYLNSYIIIGTNKGMRVGIDSGGIGFTYGPLTITSEVSDVAFFGEFVYATRVVDRNPLGGASKGLWRVSLGDNTNGVFAHACDLSVAAGVPRTVSIMGVTDNIVIGTEEGLYIETPEILSETGYVKSGRIRFGTNEKKQPVSLKVNATGNAYYGIEVSSSSGQQVQFPVLATAGSQDLDLSSFVVPDEDFDITVTLSKKTEDEVEYGPTLQQWQLRALPAPSRSRTITVSILCYDEEEDINGQLRVSSAWDRLQNLERLESSGAVVLWQNFSTGEQRQCTIRAVQFTQNAPASMSNGFGGVITMQLQTMDTE